MQKKKSPAPAKIKVDALAKELNVDVKLLLGHLKDLGIPAKTKASSIDEASAQIVKGLVSKTPKKDEPKKEQPPVKAAATVKQKEATKAPPAPVKADIPAAKPAVSEPKKTAEVPVAKAPAPAPVASPAPAPAPVPAPMPSPAPVQPAEVKPKLKQVVLSSGEITVKDLAAKLELKAAELIKELMMRKILATINQRIAMDVVKEICLKFGFEVKEEEKKELKGASADNIDPSKLLPRPPVVTIMGHVDHGKTKLLDAIRKTNVIDTEAGGITQHIGAYQVEINHKMITFLDTPGHEAFTALRARGAESTDIVVLVVAADDGVMPQTREAIDHAKASGAPIIVAVNKIDKPSANPDRVKQQLSELDLTPEEWGGQTVTVGVSAIKGTGIETLLEMILLVAEMLELKANPNTKASGVVVESMMDKSMGPVATVLVKQGTLKVGDAFVSGVTSGRIRALINDKGKRISKAGPATPVKIMGINEVPAAGDIFQVLENDKAARAVAEKNRLESDPSKFRGKVLSLEDFSKQVKSGEQKLLNLIIKADVHGSQEAIVSSLEDLTSGNVKTHIVRNSTGNITLSDIMLAKASSAIIVGFNVDFEGDSRSIAETEGIDVRMYRIIYEVIDDIKMALEGMLEPEYEEVLTGHAEVRALFKFSKVGVIAGCFVTDGKIVRGTSSRVLRESEKMFEGKLSTLKRFKDDVKEVSSGMECGITFDDFDAIKQGDIIETYEMKVKRKNVKA